MILINFADVTLASTEQTPPSAHKFICFCFSKFGPHSVHPLNALTEREQKPLVVKDENKGIQPD